MAKLKGHWKLSLDLVPYPLWGLNLRRLMTQSKWQKFRAELIERHGLRCQTCGVSPEDPSKIHAHEDWLYLERKRVRSVARLKRVSLVCALCHGVEHFGITMALSENHPQLPRATVAHFCQVNGATYEEFLAHQEEALATWERRSNLLWEIEWGTLEGWVTQKFGLDPFDLVEANANAINLRHAERIAKEHKDAGLPMPAGFMTLKRVDRRTGKEWEEIILGLFSQSEGRL